MVRVANSSRNNGFPDLSVPIGCKFLENKGRLEAFTDIKIVRNRTGRLKENCGRKLRPNFPLFTPCKIYKRGGRNVQINISSSKSDATSNIGLLLMEGLSAIWEIWGPVKKHTNTLLGLCRLCCRRPKSEKNLINMIKVMDMLHGHLKSTVGRICWIENACL